MTHVSRIDSRPDAQHFETYLTILIAEDDPLVAAYVCDVLEAAGATVCGTASTGPEALLIASAGQPNLAIVDINLAGAMDGVELGRELLSRHAIRTIFLTGVRDWEILERTLSAHPLGVLAKPFRPSQLYDTLESASRQLGLDQPG